MGLVTGTLAVLALAAGTAGAEPPATAERSALVQGDSGRKLDEYLSRLEALGYSGGLAVVKGGETVLLKGYGQADREKGVPMRPDSVFNLGSITKPFTAAAILRLQELGTLKTSDPISRFFDGVPEDKAGITLEHLLTHSSGLESDFSPTDYEPTTREEYVRRALASKLLFAPGQGYEYANAGYSLLAAVVERTTGQDSVPYGEGRVETAVRVDFERGSVYNRFLWGPRGGLVGLQAGTEPPGARYVPLSEREFVAFRLGGGGGSQPRVAFEGEGGLAVLVVAGPDGPVRLTRTP